MGGSLNWGWMIFGGAVLAEVGIRGEDILTGEDIWVAVLAEVGIGGEDNLAGEDLWVAVLVRG